MKSEECAKTNLSRILSFPLFRVVVFLSPQTYVFVGQIHSSSLCSLYLFKAIFMLPVSVIMKAEYIIYSPVVGFSASVYQ